MEPEHESESKNIIQMLNNIKQIIDVSKERNCWKNNELKDIGTTYHNVSEILRQLQDKREILEDEKEDKRLDESVEVKEEMEEID